nr:AMP-binding protein [Microbacterium sp. NIBRBAC000506063]
MHSSSGVQLLNGIGATELLHIFVSTRDDDLAPGALGTPVPGYRAAVLDDAGDEVERGTIGRLAVAGPTGCRYLNGDRQPQYVQGGWNVTGDMVVQDEDGRFWYRGRTDDMIVSSGINIGAPEVEGALNAHPPSSRAPSSASPIRSEAASCARSSC